MTPVELLREARALVATPEQWTKGAYARAASGVAVLDTDLGGATCFCMFGAVNAADARGRTSTRYGFLWGAARESLRLAVGEIWTRGGPVEFNDDPGTTHPVMLARFDRAIVLAEIAEVKK